MAERPIIVIKRNKQHEGHHGGAWKVAYADFVTAMMALFIVLWIMNSSKEIQQAVGGYFRDPKGTAQMAGSERQGSGDNLLMKKDDMPRLKEELQNAMRRAINFNALQKQIEMTITSEGLRIELLETENGTFFETGSPTPNQSGKELLTLLAQELGKLPNKVNIEGHTDSRPFPGGAGYGNWELSTDRANSARRLMQQNGVRRDQVSQVRGFADQHLRKRDNPEDASNRRISVVVQYQDDAGKDEPASFTGKPAEAAKAAAHPAEVPKAGK